MNRSLIISSVLHVVLIVLTAMSLPFLTKKPIDLPPIISVELIQITEKTNMDSNNENREDNNEELNQEELSNNIESNNENEVDNSENEEENNLIS